MDPLTITAAVATFLKTALAISLQVKGYSDSLNAVGIKVEAICHQIDCVGSILRSLQATFDFSLQDYVATATGHIGSHCRDLERSLQDGERTLEKLLGLVVDIHGRKKERGRIGKDYKLRELSNQLAALRERLGNNLVVLQISFAAIQSWRQEMWFQSVNRQAARIDDNTAFLRDAITKYHQDGRELLAEINKKLAILPDQVHERSELKNLKACLHSGWKIVSEVSSGKPDDVEDRSQEGEDEDDLDAVFGDVDEDGIREWISNLQPVDPDLPSDNDPGDDGATLSPPYHVANPDSPIVVLLIGPYRSGKTSFVNRIIKTAANEVVEGDRFGKRTAFYNIDVPTSDYVLVDKETGRVIDVPGFATEEEKVLQGSWWRKQKAAKFAVKLRDSHAPYLRLCLIDTPGLDDSEGKAFENMLDVLTTLNKLSKAEEEWRRKIDAVVLVCNWQAAFAMSFQSAISYYHASLTNLFDRLVVVNTHFSLAALSQQRQRLLNSKSLHSRTDSAARHIAEMRAKHFHDLMGKGVRSTQFFIDNKPQERYPYAELLSLNTVASILGFFRSAKPMPITEMRLIKTNSMKAVDARLQRMLKMAIDLWSEELRKRRQDSTDREVLRSSIQERLEKFRLPGTVPDPETEWLGCRLEDEPESEMYRQLYALVRQIETARALCEMLQQERPSIDKAGNAAARVRYCKDLRDVSKEDLYEFVAGAELDFDLVEPLKRCNDWF